MTTENPAVRLIRQQIRLSFEGEAWVGTSLFTSIKDLPIAQVFNRPIPKAHSIAELVRHMTAWRKYVVEKLKGNDSFEITLNTDADWLVFEEVNEQIWKDTLTALQDSQTKLLTLLKDFPDSHLTALVTGKEYTFYVLLHGIIQHDYYHLGQISMLKK
jgi:uncharacterized damage-inducible protein DinB